MIKLLRKLMLLIAASFFVVEGYAHDTVVDGIFYNLDQENYTATVTHYGGHYYTRDNEYEGNVVIPSSIQYNGRLYSVTAIKSATFLGCDNLISVTIPSTVTNIGVNALNGCPVIVFRAL